MTRKNRESMRPGEKFVGKWKVITGDMRGGSGANEEFALIDRLADDPECFRLRSRQTGRCGCSDTRNLQRLRYSAETGTLEQDDNERLRRPQLPLRCLVVWQPAEGRRFLFGMRKRVSLGGASAADPDTLAHWESPHDDGTWGAEDEAGDADPWP